MLALFHAFSLKSSQIQLAIKSGNDRLVGDLDREIEPLVAAILAYRADTSLEIYMQLQFLISLVRHAADDRSCVEKNAAALSMLLDRYFTGASSAAADMLMTLAHRDERQEALFAPEAGLSEVILDSLPDRVAVVTRDYRYLYSNAANAKYLQNKPMDLVGRHIEEFIGRPRFDGRVREKLDCCFSGQIVDYIYKEKAGLDRLKSKRCRMSPVRTSSGEVLGALIILQEASLHADVFAN